MFSFICVFVISLVFVVSGILCVPFLTLLERKVISYSQNRKGPNKVSFLGLLQPVTDGIKLIIKEGGNPSNSNFFIFLLAPFLSIVVAVFMWILLPTNNPFFVINFGLMVFICLSTFNVYPLIASSWSSNSKFSMLGGVRGAAQTISYEVNLVLLVVLPSMIMLNLSLYELGNNNSLWIFFTCNSLLVVIWLMSILAETNRAPFDFAEGESELVSGFNTEYSSLPFAMLFIAEYSNIIFLSLLTIILFFSFGPFLNILISNTIVFVYLWARTSFPRFRYDLLMSLSWKLMLPLVIVYFFWVL